MRGQYLGKRSTLSGEAGLRFDIEMHGAKANHTRIPGFALEFAGKVYAYQNCCPHLGLELDWIPGVFFDEQGEHIVCATHGAQFEPDTGKCVSGPCVGQALKALAVKECGEGLYLCDEKLSGEGQHKSPNANT